MQVVGSFLFLLFVLAMLGTILNPRSQTRGVINSLSSLLTNSISAAKK